MFALLRYDRFERLIGVQDDCFVRPIQGTVVLCGPGRPPEGIDVGTFSAVYIDRVGALREGEDVERLLEGLSGELADLHRALYDGNAPACRPEVNALWQCPPESGNILAIPCLSIYSGFRGKGLGLATLWQLLRTQAQGAGVVALRACPLQFCQHADNEAGRQWAARVQLQRFAGMPPERAREKLVRHYGKLDFVPLGRDGLMLFNTRQRIPLPPAVRSWVTPLAEAV